MAKFDDQDTVDGLGVKGELKHLVTIAEIVVLATLWFTRLVLAAPSATPCSFFEHSPPSKLPVQAMNEK
ncbi:MAG: hypothetical protein ACK511_02205 [Burkholderiales bacterium]|nr:hypothetical protein [Betaproteobacteria bacterium]